MTSPIQPVRGHAFKEASKSTWKETVEAALKGKPFESLSRSTYEGIKLQPLYTHEDINLEEMEQLPGGDTNLRGFSTGQKTWAIAQEIWINNEDELMKNITAALENGQDAISFKTESLQAEKIDSQELIKLANEKNVPIFLRIHENFSKWLKELGEKREALVLRGTAASDLISYELSKGHIVRAGSKEIADWRQVIERAHQLLPNVCTILIDTVPYHNAGANAVQELGISLAAAVTYMEAMKESNWEPAKTVQKMVFHFGMGSQFFMEAAKLRAFRRLWTTAASAYGLTQKESKVTVSCETSSFTKSALDPHVNILRSANEAFAAIIGGVDYLHVAPFDGVYKNPGSLSERLGRNTQLILREEAHLGFVTDPSGGSYYVEALTSELVEKAWDYFLKIEKQGGLLESLMSGGIQADIKQTLNVRMEDSYTRKSSIIGTNVYANLQDTFIQDHPSEHFSEQNNPLALSKTRRSEAFEQLRRRSLKLRENGKNPKAGIICLGALKDHKARLDYVSGFLAVGGIEADCSGPCLSMQDITSFIEQHSYPYYCLCGQNESYAQFAQQSAEWLKSNKQGVLLDIAGLFPTDEWEDLQEAGFNGSIYIRQNMIEKLDSLLGIWEGQVHE
ncbi:methylmalonyl-CoA mutase family protein [Heyndrickxia acidicola]|uniref:Methylmalonyl-CoA mutase family protein n=1 Tax=Heyndrickxia acidicola TaxID=209389 RepID=A0ABU6MLQ9_9BACI|nr:methylmalonyl-CoA mutase family protein [Heyndrickxia acidicola]MED1205229.1 methylmalonyl-CoA mutase family protein [Heyndrickxia acidicola]